MATAACTAVLTLFLVRALGVKQYGLFALAIGMSSVAIPFADLGISISTARFAGERRGHGPELRTLVADALKLKVLVTGCVCALMAALAPVIAGAFGDAQLVWPVRGIAIATFGQSLFMMLVWVTTALGRAVVNIRLVAAESVLELSASVSLVVIGAGAAGAAFGRAIGYVVGAAIAASAVLRMSGDAPLRFWSLPSRTTVQRVGVYARSVFAIDASYTLSSSLCVLILGAYSGAAASGTFQAPAKLIVLIGYVGAALSNGVAPRLTRGAGQEPNVRALHGALRFLIAFQCLVLAPVVVWAGPITHVLFGSGYAKSADVLRALAPYIFFSGLAPLVTSGVNFMGEARRRVPIALATLALTAAGAWILIPRDGVVGAAIATDIAFAFYTLAHIWLCRRLLQLRIDLLVWALGCGLTAAAAMGVVLAAVGTKNLTTLDWLKGGAGGVATYVSMLLFTREIRRTDVLRGVTMIRALVARMPGAPRLRLPGPVAITGPATFVDRPQPRTSTAARRPGAPTRLVENSPSSAMVASSTAARPGSPVPDDKERRGFGRRVRSLVQLGRPPRSASGRSPIVGRDISLAPRPAAARPAGQADGLMAEAPVALVDVGTSSSLPQGVDGFPKTPLSSGAAPGPRDPAHEPWSIRTPRRWAGLPGPAGAAAADVRPLGGGHAPREAPGSETDGKLRPRRAAETRRRSLPAAAQPPGWLLNARSARLADRPVRTNEAAAGSASAGFARLPQMVGLRYAREAWYEITWRPEDAVFELCAADPAQLAAAAKSPTSPAEQSPLVPWRWRMPPAPAPEARRAHAALVDRLLAAGWQRAGSGEAWFADRFTCPDHAADVQEKACQ